MLIKEIIDGVYSAYGSRYQVKPEKILQNLNLIHQLALNRDINQFLVWDIPILVDQANPLGPYPYPEPRADDPNRLPRCRKLYGVTDASDKSILADIFGRTNYQSMGDYGFSRDDESANGNIYVPGRIDNIRRRFTFSSLPDPERTYRWVYYMAPHQIIDETDDSKILIPESWHFEVLYNGTQILTDTDSWGGKTSLEMLRPILDLFWQDMETGESGLNGQFTEAT